MNIAKWLQSWPNYEWDDIFGFNGSKSAQFYRRLKETIGKDFVLTGLRELLIAAIKSGDLQLQVEYHKAGKKCSDEELENPTCEERSFRILIAENDYTTFNSDHFNVSLVDQYPVKK